MAAKKPLPENEQLKKLRADRDRGKQDLLQTLRTSKAKGGPKKAAAATLPGAKGSKRIPVPKSAPRWNERLQAARTATDEGPGKIIRKGPDSIVTTPNVADRFHGKSVKRRKYWDT